MNLNSLSTIGVPGAVFLALLMPIAVMALMRPAARAQGLFPYLVGSIIAWIILGFVRVIQNPSVQGNAFFIALAIVAVIFLWKFLFGPWGSRVKAAVLGVFLFWIAVHLLIDRTVQERIAMVLAAAIAAIPAAIWCLMFLREHMQRLSIVLLTFFAGCLSTAPILFYDFVVKSGAELNFFLFRVVPESFHATSRSFVTQALTGEPGIISASVAVTVVSFALVGVIEEWSKHWVIRKSNPAYFASVNDVIQFSIIAAIGFAFAENIVNPNYFIAFVQNYLVMPEHARWGQFFGSVFGRSVITNMVHITCSGVFGYFYGLAFFAKPAMEDDHAHGRRHRFVVLIARITGLSRIRIYRHLMMATGLFSAIVLHSAFDVAVSLPQAFPGVPQTVGGMPIVLIPALLYVFGGFALLTFLFHRKADIHEYGYRLKQEVFVRPVESPVV